MPKSRHSKLRRCDRFTTARWSPSQQCRPQVDMTDRSIRKLHLSCRQNLIVRSLSKVDCPAAAAACSASFVWNPNQGTTYATGLGLSRAYELASNHLLHLCSAVLEVRAPHPVRRQRHRFFPGSNDGTEALPVVPRPISVKGLSGVGHGTHGTTR
jgi:hypothetical protein